MMSDGIHGNGAEVAQTLSEDAVETDLFAHASRVTKRTAAAAPCPADLAEWLPRLGSVLWLERFKPGTDRQACTRPSTTLLLDHPALAVLFSSTQLRAHHAITAHGPREWLCFHSTNGTVEAKLFLLPDSNVLAWDEMNLAFQIHLSAAECEQPPTHGTFLGRALSHFGQRWQARLLEFRCLRRPWLSVLDARPPLRISLLGIDIARDIVRDEYAEWISPMHQG